MERLLNVLGIKDASKVKDALKFLDQTEEEVITLNFGLKGKAYTPNRISKITRIPKEVIIRIKKEALEKIRSVIQSFAQ